MMVTTFPATAVTAMETREKYPYTLFAASETEGAITITGNACINGDIATNGTVAVSGSTINVNGPFREMVLRKMF